MSNKEQNLVRRTKSIYF